MNVRLLTVDVAANMSYFFSTVTWSVTRKEPRTDRFTIVGTPYAAPAIVMTTTTTQVQYNKLLKEQ